jgi:hypothetical protein
MEAPSPAAAKDVPEIIDFALECAKAYPSLRADKGRIKTMAEKSISSPACYTSVVRQAGTVQACLMTIVTDHVWAERKVAHVTLWASNVPGAGNTLLKDFIQWMAPRRGIRMAGVTPDFEWDYRAGLLLTRAGFEERNGSYRYYN